MRCRALILLALMITLLSGCVKPVEDNTSIYKKIYEKFKTMQGYKAQTEILVVSNNSKNKYSITQYFMAPNKTRSETTAPEDTAGVITIVDGVKTAILNPKGKAPVIIEALKPSELNYLYINSFFEAYYKSEKANVNVNAGGKEKIISLTAQTGSANPYRKTAVLRLDTIALKPIDIQLMGEDNQPYCTVTFKTYEHNPQLDPALFTIN